jgi:hypothetical protein
MLDYTKIPAEFLVSMDPGKKLLGLAIFKRTTKELTRAVLIKGDEPALLGVAVADFLFVEKPMRPKNLCFVSEYPQVYRFSKGDPNDLLPLSECVGAVKAALLSHELIAGPEYWATYLPREWKGQVPKDVMVSRIQERLSKDERARVELPRAKSLSHNVWDAIGIGLKALGRL